MYTIIKRLKDFSYAHRLTKGYPGKCRGWHGHNAHVEVQIEAQELDQYDMVVDFGQLKTFDDWIQKNFDHALLLQKEDTLIGSDPTIPTKFYVMEHQRMPTAEALAKELYHVFNRLNAIGKAQIVSVRVWETDNCSAIYTAEGLGTV